MKKQMIAALCGCMIMTNCTGFTYANENSADLETGDSIEYGEVVDGDEAYSLDDYNDLAIAIDDDGNVISASEVDESEFNGYIVKLKDDLSAREEKHIESAAEKNDEIEAVVEDEYYTVDSIEAASEMADPDQIEYIEPNYKIGVMSIPSESKTDDSNTDCYSLIDIDNIFNNNVKAKGVKVGIIDTGIAGYNTKKKHADLDYTHVKNGKAFAYDYWFDYKYPENMVEDGHGHGTFVAGEIAATRGNGKGVRGMAYGADIIPIKVLDDDGCGETAELIEGLDYADKQGCDVVNMSIGGYDRSIAMEEVINRMAKKGTILCAAAGNESESEVCYPAGYSNVICVTASEKNGQFANYSNYENGKVDCIAPGDFEGLDAGSTNSYINAYGTSMAAPVVSSLAAQLKAVDPNMTTSQFRVVLSKTCKDLGIEGKDRKYGWGMVDFDKAYDYAATVSGLGNKVYTGKEIKPEVSLTVNGKSISKNDYTVTYKNNKNPGMATVTISGQNNFKGTVTKTFKINPKSTELSTLTAVKNGINIKWKKQSAQTSGYQIKYSTDSSMSNPEYHSIAGAKKTSYKLRTLEGSTKYYVQIRTYKTVNGVRYESAWSPVKSVTTGGPAFKDGQVAGVKAKAASSTSVKLTWNAYGGATKYNVYCSTTKNDISSKTFYDKPDAKKTGNSCTVTNLKKGQTYYFYVFAAKPDKNSPNGYVYSKVGTKTFKL